MVDMRDDGEIADFGQISHAWGYDLDLAIGQAGTADLRHSFRDEHNHFGKLDSDETLAVTGRVFLRSLYLSSEDSHTVSDMSLQQTLKLVLEICEDPKQEVLSAASEVFLDYYADDKEIQFSASSSAVEFNVSP